MSIKKHFDGGSLRTVMVTEIKRVLAETGTNTQGLVKAAVELGVCSKSLENWIRKPEDKGGWPELQEFKGVMEKVVGTKPRVKKKRTRKKLAS